MSTPDQPAPAASPFFAPGPAPAAAPLPPAAPAEVRPSRWPGRLDAVFAGTVLAFAFLAASSVARNSDLWQHLASGRLLAERQYRFGADPFAYTTEGAYWANHSWLFDLALHRFYQAFGGATLVVLKALAVVALAALMLSIRRRDTAPWVPAACTAVALLTMSPRLLLQPVCASYLFLGVALWLLWQIHTAARERPLQLVALPLLCAVWVNVDDWFLLGPALVALFWLGEVLGAAFGRGPGPKARNVPGWLVPLALAVCLLNPHGYRAFTLPAELSPWLAGTGLADDARFRALFDSPWRGDNFARLAADFRLAAWAYFLLVGLGLVSFGRRPEAVVGWRGTVFAAFGLLAAWNARAIPFFAVVAGPITALNFQDALAGRPAPAARQRRAVAGRLALVAVGLGLLVAAWTGWPQGSAREGRRVGWGVQADPSLERVAHTLADWRQRGVFRDGERGFAVHPAVADYCAWFAPTEKGFLDHRFTLSPPAVVRQFEDVCRGLGGESEGRSAWRGVLREHGVRYLVLYDRDPRRLLGPLQRLTADGADWALLRIDGRALVFAWRDGGANDGGKSDMLWFDPARLAFGPQDEAARAALPAAPGDGPGRPPTPAGVRARFLPLAPPTWESDAAALYLLYFDATAAAQAQARGAELWARHAAGLAGLAAGPGAPLRLASQLPAPPGLNDRPPALPLLAVRAARRAVAANPDDADAWLWLGQAYEALGRATGEGALDGRRPLLGLLRHAQTATALENALRRHPGLLPARLRLAALYSERQYLDAALDHYRVARDLVRQGGPAPGEGADDFARRLGPLEAGVEQLEQAVQDRQNQFAVRAQGLPPSDSLGRARVAVGLGLARKALDEVLLPSQDVLFGAAGARLELELLLLLGRAEEVRDKLAEPGWQQNKDKLGAYELLAPGPGGAAMVYRLPAYDWLRACQAAATGDYDLADDCLGAAGRQLGAEAEALTQRLGRPLARTLATEMGLASTSRALLPLPVGWLRVTLAGVLGQAGTLRLGQADLAVVSGLLALERGEPAAAARHFRASLGLAPHSAGRPVALEYLGRLRRAGSVD
jgi:hypothetical protein